MLDLIVTRWLGPWGVYGQLVFINLGISLLLVVPVWHFISGYFIARYHHPKLDILVNLAIGVGLSVMHNMSIIGTLSTDDDPVSWLLFMGVSSIVIIGSRPKGAEDSDVASWWGLSSVIHCMLSMRGQTVNYHEYHP